MTTLLVGGALLLTSCGSGSGTSSSPVTTAASRAPTVTTTTAAIASARSAYISFLKSYHSSLTAFTANEKAWPTAPPTTIDAQAKAYGETLFGLETQLSNVQWPTLASGDMKMLIRDIGKLSGDIFVIAGGGLTSQSNVTAVGDDWSAVAAQGLIVAGDLGVKTT